MKKPENNNKEEKDKKMPSKKEQDSVQELLNSILMKHMTEELSYEKQMQKEHVENIECLVPILNEYLSNYIVIGHDIIGNEVMFSFAKNSNDKNAIGKLFHDSFIRFMIQQQNGMQ